MPKVIAEQGQLICAPASLVWKKLTQVNEWTQWLPKLRVAELLETPKLDAIGKITPANGKPYHFKFVGFDPESQFQLSRPYKFGTHLTHTYTLIKNAEGVVVTIELVCEGKLELQVGFLTRRKLRREIQEQSFRLKTVCEMESATQNQSSSPAA